MHHAFNDGGRVRGGCRHSEGGAVFEDGVVFHVAWRRYALHSGHAGQ